VGGVGGAALIRGLRSGGAFGGLLATLGAGLLTRATTNLPTRRLVGLDGGEGTIRVQKTLNVSVPIEQVWALWSNFENFPRFMRHLREVRRLDERRSQWIAAGPAGISVEWNAETTEWLPREKIAWRSVAGSRVTTSGVVRFRRAGDQVTEIDVRLSYTPPAGALGHAVATLFGVDPKHSMDEDMVRLKSLLEDGSTSSGKGRDRVRLEEIEDRQELPPAW
jgi:uncharacterized membrane protein